MTQPVSAVPSGELAEGVAVGVRELIAQAKKFGLTWDLRPARVVSGSDAANIVATYDGDLIPMNMTSLIGTLSAGQRVHAVMIPPAGHFIIGQSYIHAQNLYGQSGIELISFSALSSTTVPVVFDVPFTETPSVHVNIASGDGSTAAWQSRGINVTTTGFTIFVYGSSSTWTSVPVHWIASRVTQ